MDLRIEVFGEQEACLTLEGIPPRIGGANLERMLVAGALIPTNRAKENCPKRTGNLARGIHIGGHSGLTGGLRGTTGTHGGTSGTNLGGNGHTATSAHILAGTNVEYADAVENGSAAHVIEPRNAGALFWPGLAHPVPRVNHPGTAPQPFMRPAFDGCGPEVAAEIAAACRALLGTL